MTTPYPARISRRELGGLAIAATATWGCRRAAAEAPAQDQGWIDAHVHVWTPDVESYPIDGQFAQADMQPASFTPQELFQHSQPAGVTRVVLIQMSFYKFDHAYMLAAMREHPGVFAGVALIDHTADDVVERMQQLAEQGMRGFRLHSQGDAQQWVSNAAMGRLWQAAAARKLAICPLINPADIPHVAALCQKHPDTTVVVDHFARVGISGTIDPTHVKMLCDLAKFPQVHVKTSAFYALGKKTPPYDDLKPMVRRVVDAFGPERLMWASDCPFQVQDHHTYEASIALIRDRCDFLSDSDKQWLLRDTAHKIFFS